MIACKHDVPPVTGTLELVDAASTGAISTLVTSELHRAEIAHKKLVVYVGATWCEPCRRFHDAAAQGELDSELGDLRLLVFDLDRDGASLEIAGYHSAFVPLFAIPRADGIASGRQIDGSIKGSDAARDITPRLRALVDGQ